MIWLLPISVGGQVDVVARDPAPAARSPFVRVCQLVSPSVVNIRTVRSVTREGVDINPLQEMFRRFFPGGEAPLGERMELPSTGSGFVVSDESHILTNHHVIALADEVFVRFTGEQREYPATVLGVDPNTDLALLQIETERGLTPLQFGDSDAIAVGDWAIAIGNPFGNLEGSLTVGVVSAKGRSDLVISGNTPRYQDFIQTDASINFGNSGGPLVDIDGRVIGVNTAVNTGGQGISFAIPSNLARRIYGQLLTHGRVIRGYLGIRTEPFKTSDADLASESTALGASIVAVLPDTPAAASGMVVGDIIVSFAGQPVHSPHQLQFLIAAAEVGQEIPCLVTRAGATVELSVTPSEFQSSMLALPDGGDNWFGMEVESLSDSSVRVTRLKETLGITDDTGVIVVTVEPASPAAVAGIRPGDVLVTINGFEVSNRRTYRHLRGQMSGHTEPVQVLVRTGTMENYLLLHHTDQGMEQ
ncbi:MAG: trypsin-like peptidase domain-containing protein [bacterium]